MRKENRILQLNNIKEEFENSLDLRERNVFCTKEKFDNKDKEDFIKCKICGIICCIACKEICHKNCKRMNFYEKLPDFTISEYFSCCECSHKNNQKRTDLFYLPCFYSKFFAEEFQFEEKFYKNKINVDDKKCEFCFENCTFNKDEYKVIFSTDNDIADRETECKCNEIDCHRNFSKKLSFIRLNFKKYTLEKKISINEIKEKLRKKLSTFFNQFDNKNYYCTLSTPEEINDFINLEVKNFSIYLLLYKTQLDKVERNNEREELIINSFKNFEENQNVINEKERCKNTGKTDEFHIRENEKLILTLIFHYFKKKLFLKIKMLKATLLNVTCIENRLKILDKNLKIREDMDKNKIFEINHLKNFFNEIKSYRNFVIKLSDINHEVPFPVYFIKLLFQSYSFRFCETEILLQILKEIKYKRDYYKYNSLIRSNFDEAFYICQIIQIDLFFYGEKNKNILGKEKNLKNQNNNESENVIKIDLSLKEILDLLYFSSDKSHFHDYISKMFSIEDIYLEKLSQRKNGDEGNEYEYIQRLQNMKKDKLYYFDCFHSYFIEKMFKKKNQKNDDGIYLEDSKKKIPIEHSDIKHRNTVQYFRFTKIAIHDNKIDQLRTVEKYMKKILKKFNLENLSEEIEDKKEVFLENLLLNLKELYKKKKKSGEVYNFNLYIEGIPEKYKEIQFCDLSKEKLDEFKCELRYIFYVLFIMEYHKNSRFLNNLFDWNLILLCFLFNENNINFLISELKFFDFLLHIDEKKNEDGKKMKNSFLIRCLYNTRKYSKNDNITWRFFYLIFKYYINNTLKFDYLEYFKYKIYKGFVCEIFDFYTNQHLKREALKHLIFINESEEQKNNEVSEKEKDENFELIQKICNSGKKIKLSEEDYFLENINYNLIYYFLKIVKKMLIEENVNLIFPFNYMVNKFETLEKLSFISNIIFKKKFNVEKFLKSYSMFILNEGKQINLKKKFSRLENKQAAYEIEEINFNNDLNKELEFQDNAEKNEDNNLFIQNVELTMKATFSDYPQISSMDKDDIISNRLLKKLNEFSIQNLFFEILGNMKSTSEINVYFQVINQNLKIYEDFFKNLPNNIKENSHLEKYLFKLCKNLINFILNFLSIKHYDNSKINIIVDTDLTEEDLEEIIKIEKKSINSIRFPISIENEKLSPLEKYQINKLKLHILSVIEIFLFLDINKSENLNEIQELICEKITSIYQYINMRNIPNKKINQIFVKKIIKIHEVLKNFVCLHEKENHNNEKNHIDDYFNFFIKYDTRKNSMYSKLIRYILLPNSKGFKDKKHSLCQESNLYNHLNKPDSKEIDFSIFDKDFNYNYWKNINSNKTDKNNRCKMDILLKYLFNHLSNLEGISTNHLFDYVFSENFLKMVNFFNNILYYKPAEIQKFLKESLTEKQMMILLKNVIRLNYYIIDLAKHETNKKLLSISKVYFSLMDFFILLGEGIFEDEYQNFFFKDIENTEILENSNKIEEKIKNGKNFSKKNVKKVGENIKFMKEIDDKKEYFKNIEVENLRNLYMKTATNKKIIFSKPELVIGQIEKKSKKWNNVIGMNDSIIEEENINDSMNLDTILNDFQSKIRQMGHLTFNKIKKHFPEINDDLKFLYENINNLINENKTFIGNENVEFKLESCSIILEFYYVIFIKIYIYFKDKKENIDKFGKGIIIHIDNNGVLNKTERKLVELLNIFKLKDFEKLVDNIYYSEMLFENVGFFDQIKNLLEYGKMITEKLNEFFEILCENFSNEKFKKEDFENFLFKNFEKFIEIKNYLNKLSDKDNLGVFPLCIKALKKKNKY